jgi:hypothetical protein
MKPLPAQLPDLGSLVLPVSPPALDPPTPAYSKSNRRASGPPPQRAYPWLLGASTALSAAFCLLYLTKPVIVASQPDGTAEAGSAAPARSLVLGKNSPNRLLPDRHRLPGEASAGAAIASASASAAPPVAAEFEQTNLRIQHILTAETPGGQLAKIDLDVPVLYRSRGLRWTASEVGDARALLARLGSYQEKSRALRTEAEALLGDWNQLVTRSIPAADLRADSPTLPANQLDASAAPRPAGLDTAEAITIQHPADQ